MKRELFREERLKMIMQIIDQQKSVTVEELANQFEKSAGSIRLDLSELEKRGLIARTHGGAILIDNKSEDVILQKNLLLIRGETKAEEKKRIGKAVVDLIHDGDSILIDGGSTTYYVSQYLHKKRNLKIITTSMHLFPILWQIPDAVIYLTGGVMHREYEDTYGEITLETINRFKPDHTIMGIDGVSCVYGFTTVDPAITMVKREMVKVSKDLIIAADSSKFGKVCLLSVANIKDAQVIVTDDGLEDEFPEKIRAQGVELIVT